MSRSKYLTMISSAALSISVGTLVQGCEGLLDSATRAGLPIQQNALVTVAPQPGVDLIQTEHTVSFTGGATTLSPAESQRLLAFLDQIRLAPSDRLSVVSSPRFASAGTGQSLASARREEAVVSLLANNRLPVSPLPADVAVPAARNGVTVVVRRYIVRLPACPDWSSTVWDNYDNQPHSNWGCATAINLGQMVADPADLVAGREETVADGELQARSIERYREGKTKDLIRDAAASDTFGESDSAESEE